MNYKELVKEMLDDMKNKEYLQNIYYFVKVMYEKDKKERR